MTNTNISNENTNNTNKNDNDTIMIIMIMMLTIINQTNDNNDNVSDDRHCNPNNDIHSDYANSSKGDETFYGKMFLTNLLQDEICN